MRTTTHVLGLALVATLASCTTLYLDFTTYVSVGGGGSTSSTSTSAGGQGGALLCTPGTTQSCYSGEPATEGQGVCRAGAQACAADGTSWGACEGEVLPQPVDDCVTPEDDNCDGIAPGCEGALLWAKRFGDIGEQQATSIATDIAGNVLVTGYFEETIDFGGGPLVSGGGSDAFLAKLDPNGNHVWSKRFGGAGSQTGSAVVAHPSGDLLVGGTFGGTIDFGGGPLASSGVSSVFVARLDANGDHVWSAQFDSPSAELTSMAIDGDGNVLVAGFFLGSIDLGGGPLQSAGDVDLFVGKLNADGGYAWGHPFGGTGDQEARAVAVDGAGNVLIAGRFQGAVDFGNGVVQSAGGFDGFVAKLDPFGSALWSKPVGDTSDQSANGVAIDGAGNVVVTGSFAGTASFGGSTLSSAGGGDIFLAKLDTNGAELWSQRYGDSSEQDATGVVVDTAGSMAITGSLYGQANFGGGPLGSVGASDAFVAKIGADVTHQWSKRFGDAQYQLGQAIATDAGRNVVIAGYFSGEIDFGGGSLVSVGGNDVFIAKFSP